MGIAVRTLTEADLDWAASLLAATGLSARQAELRRHLALEPGGLYAAEVDGRPAGLGSYVAYDALAFIGNMAVAPDLQGRGVGGAILERLLREIEGRGIPAAVLEATPAGERLYRRNGFVAQHRTLAYLRGPRPTAPGPARTPVQAFRAEDLEEVAAFDAPRFGAFRGRVLARLLREFPGRGFVARRPAGHVAGYVIAQPRILGPWAADDAGVAEALLEASLALPFDGPPVAYAAEVNAAGAALLLRHGFAPRPEALRMQRGGGPAGRPERIYGQAALALG